MLDSKLNPKYLLIISILLLMSACKKDNADNNRTANPIIENQFLDRKYNEVCFLTTHNSMNTKEDAFAVPNQTLSITHQLEYGVRGLMIDTYDGSNNVALTYHALAHSVPGI